jgi:hypothetical protein
LKWRRAAPTRTSLSELFKLKFTLGQVVKFGNEFGINFAVSKSEHQEFTCELGSVVSGALVGDFLWRDRQII